MITTILASGDHHFDERSPRWDECLRVHKDIVEIVERERPTLFVSTGDVYERASTPTERLYAALFFQAVAEFCPVIIVRGNHDAPKDLALLAELESQCTIVVCETPRVLSVCGVSVAAVPWPTRAGAVDDGAARSALRDVLLSLGGELAQGPEDMPRILCGHFDCDGAVSGAGQPIIGGSLRVSLADLALAQADAVIMGHIHRAQEFSVGAVPMLYAGSPFRRDFGEVEEKSIVRLRFDGRRLSWCRIPTRARPMILVNGAWDGARIACDADGELLDAASLNVKDADVRLVYQVPAAEVEIARRAAAELRDRWLAGGAATVKLDPDPVAEVRARAPQVAVARTVDEKLVALWEVRHEEIEPVRKDRLLHKLATLTAKEAA